MLLKDIEENLPCGGNEWEAVAMRFNRSLPNGVASRDADSLKAKFKSLRNVKKPTGDPSCPEEVKRAKRAQYSIEARMGVSNMDDDEGGHISIDNTALTNDDDFENSKNDDEDSNDGFDYELENQDQFGFEHIENMLNSSNSSISMGPSGS